MTDAVLMLSLVLLSMSSAVYMRRENPPWHPSILVLMVAGSVFMLALKTLILEVARP